MSPPSTRQPPAPAAASLAGRVAAAIGTAARDERRRRQWTAGEVARRAHVSPATVTNVEAGRRASLDVYARLALVLGLSLDVSTVGTRGRGERAGTDFVHAAMGELEAGKLAALGYRVAIDHPYQHYQFAGRADLLAWAVEPARLLHIENRTRFPDLQQVAGSFNAKRHYLAPVLADQLGIGRFASMTHVMVALWSSEVIHSIRIRQATFRALCPDPDSRVRAWLEGDPPATASSSSLVLLDLFATQQSRMLVGLDGVLAGVRPRIRGYREAAERLRSEHRA